jgi:hypothetical protein
VPIHRSAKAFALGACTGVSTTSASSDRGHLVEGAAELRIPIAEHEAHPSPLSQLRQQLAGLLGDQVPARLAVTPARWTRRVSSSMKNSTYNRRSQTVSTVKKSQVTIPAACCRRNACQVVAARRGAGSSP